MAFKCRDLVCMCSLKAIFEGSPLILWKIKGLIMFVQLLLHGRCILKGMINNCFIFAYFVCKLVVECAV